MARLVLDRHRPTLIELLGPVPRWIRIMLVILAVLILAALVASRLAPGATVNVYVHRSDPQFNFAYGDRLDRRPTARTAEMVRFEQLRGTLFVQSFAVRSVTLPPYGGDVGGILPLAAEREIDALQRRHRQFELEAEGKARINDIPGYEFSFRARLGERRLYGRVVLLPELVPGSRQAVALELLGTPVSGISSARDVGTNAVLKQPLRSFRFGTERP